jgi:hypothetical protein
MPNHSTLSEGTDYRGNEDCHHDFDFDSLDSLEDKIKEAIAKGESVTKLVFKLVEMESDEKVTEMIARVICVIADAKKPGLVADHVAYISGMRANKGWGATEYAKRHGMSDQAFSQTALALAKVLRLKPSRAMRSDMGKLAMRNSHFKRTKV